MRRVARVGAPHQTIRALRRAADPAARGGAAGAWTGARRHDNFSDAATKSVG